MMTASELREEAFKIARTAALAGGQMGDHDYLPKTEEDAANWQPHEWVLGAIALAIQTALTKEGVVVVTKNDAGQILAVTRQDEEGRVLRIISESNPI